MRRCGDPGWRSARAWAACLALLLPWLGGAAAQSAVYQYSAPIGERRAYLWIPDRCTYVRGVVIALSNLTERVWLEHPLVRKAAAEECLAIIWVGGGGKTPLRADLDERGGEALDALLSTLAGESGYTELALAPLIPMGHSANGQFAWTAAGLHPDHVIAAIPIKTIPFPSSLGFTGVPLLYLVGETTEWPQFRDGSRPGDRDFYWPVVRDGAIALRSANEANLIGVVTEPGAGHFDFSDDDARFLALFLHKACAYRLGARPAEGRRPVLKEIRPESGWLTDTGGPLPDHEAPAPYARYTGDRRKAFWFFDEETARAAVQFNGDRISRARQMPTFVEEGRLLAVAKQGFAKLRFIPEADGISFSVQGGFLTEIPPELVAAGTPLGHAAGRLIFRRITGPAQQVGPNRFQVHFDRGTLDGAARPTECPLWIEEEQPGDAAYRRAVQPGQMVIPTRLSEGGPQRIDLPLIRDQKKGTKSMLLQARSTSGLPVAYYVVAGPAVIKGQRLLFKEVPVRGHAPIKVTVVAYQWGRVAEPLVQSAEPRVATFALRR